MTDATRAQALLNSQIAKLDEALGYLTRNKRAYLPSIYQNLRDALNSHREKALWYLGLPNHGGETALGMMGRNGRGPLIDRTISDVHFHANRARYVPPAYRQEMAA